jgi:hypothetical protein
MVRFLQLLFTLTTLCWTTAATGHWTADDYNGALKKFILAEVGGSNAYRNWIRLPDAKVVKLLKSLDKGLIGKIVGKKGENEKQNLLRENLTEIGGWLAKNKLLWNNKNGAMMSTQLFLSFVIQLAFSVGKTALDVITGGQETAAGQTEEKVDLQLLLTAYDYLVTGKETAEMDNG